MSDAVIAEFRAVLEAHPGFIPNNERTRIRCTGCREVMPILDPKDPQPAFTRHVLKGFADAANELASWRKMAAALGPDLTGLTGLELAVATAREGDLVEGVFHNVHWGDVRIKGVLVPSINAGQLLVGNQVINHDGRPASGLRSLEILAPAETKE